MTGVEFTVADLARSLEWFSEVLGLATLHEGRTADGRALAVVDGGTVVFTLVEAGPGETPGLAQLVLDADADGRRAVRSAALEHGLPVVDLADGGVLLASDGGAGALGVAVGVVLPVGIDAETEGPA